MSAINVNSITGRTGTHGPVLTGVTTVSNNLHIGTGGTVFITTTSGNVGLGTDNPASTLDVRSNDTRFKLTSNESGQTVGMTLKGGASDGFTYNFIESISNVDSQNWYIGGNGTANTFAVKTGGSERLRINSSGHVGVGTDNPKAQTWRNGTALDVHGGSGSVVGNLHIGANRGDGVQTVGSLVFYDNTQDTNHKVISIIESDKTGSTSNQRGGTVTVYVKEDATVSNSAVESATFTKDGISFPSGNGIDFSATTDATGMTSELLDDYEEGTWTPTVTSAGYTQEGSNQFGIYTKIGRLVHISGQFSFSAINSFADSSVQFSGLPFTVRSGGHQVGVARETETTGAMFVMQVNENATTMGMNSMDGISDNSNVQIASGKNYNFSVTYEI